MYRYFLFILIYVSCFKLQAQEEVLSLEEVIEIGLKNNYDILVANNNLEIADNNVSLGNAGFLPYC